MKPIRTLGMAAGCLVALGGVFLLVYQRIGPPDAKEPRVWNLMRWLHLRLPTPDDPGLIGPTLAVLNTPLWLLALALGLLMLAGFWLARAAN